MLVVNFTENYNTLKRLRNSKNGENFKVGNCLCCLCYHIIWWIKMNIFPRTSLNHHPTERYSAGTKWSTSKSHFHRQVGGIGCSRRRNLSAALSTEVQWNDLVSVCYLCLITLGTWPEGKGRAVSKCGFRLFNAWNAMFWLLTATLS